MDLASDNWQRAKRLFEAALELEPSQWPAFLLQNCPENTLRQEVEELLLNYQKAGSFLEYPAADALNSEPDASTKNPGQESSGSPRSEDPANAANSSGNEDPLVGRIFGSYKLLRRLGQGGMAAVYLAARADYEYEKQVAIKVVQPGPDCQNLLSRFRNERQTLAGLDHPNIVKLLDGGSTPEGLPFLVMDYVDGCPIDDYCDQHKLCIDERLQVFSKVCEAVYYAHQKGIVHRDLKPANILVIPDGTPKLLDFGIAKVLRPEPSRGLSLATQTGTRCMTPAYASPEQMRGKSVNAATDIYSLGVVLYELLSGHRPYRLTQNTPAEVERAICEQDPETPSTAIDRVETDTSYDGVPITRSPELVSRTREGHPEKLRRRLRGDLDNIVLKALQKDPARRYGSVQALAHDILLHVQHLPVSARPGTLGYRASKFVGRHKVEVGMISAVILVLVAVASVAFNFSGVHKNTRNTNSMARAGSTNAIYKQGWTGRRGPEYDTRPIAGTIGPVVECESIAKLEVPNTTVTATYSVPAGSFTAQGTDPIPNLPPFCRVQGIIRPSPDSDIRFEVWLPSTGWNGRFRGVENGGFGGSINFVDMAPWIRYGYATASTDTGHRSEDTDASWALHHPEKVIDAGYRAIHEMTEKSKQIIRTFYGKPPIWSFFQGCSNGGRQALIEAQRFPDDYNGILAGGAPLSTLSLLAAGFYNSPLDDASYIPPRKISAISRAVLAACDGLDGVSDGILNDPRQCHFNPSVLVCRGTDSDDCLTPPQVSQLKKIYRGLRTSKGEELLPGYLPGGEEGDAGWKSWIIGDTTPEEALNYVFGIGTFRNMVFDDPTWDFRKVSVEKAIRVADKKLGPILDVGQPDLQAFKAHGGKLILYHGWSDPETPAQLAINYYNAALATMGAKDVDGFLRLYLAPGMQHCYSGPGPNFFGQFDASTLGGNPDQNSIPTDAQHNISTALEDWVEHGVAPNAIIATKFVNDSDPGQGIKMTRPLCPYPQTAKYKGTGDTNDAANFACIDTSQHRRELSP